MSRNELIELLAKAGLRTGEADLGRSNKVDRLDSVHDPSAVEQLGVALADRLRDCRPNRVVVWDDPENAVLGHIVARELGTTVIRAMDAQGGIDYDGTLQDGDRIVVVAVAYRHEAPLGAMLALVTRRAGSVANIAALIDTPVLQTYRSLHPVTALVAATGTPTGSGV